MNDEGLALRALAGGVLAVLAWSNLAFADKTPQREAREHFDQGLRLVDAGRFEEAASQFKRAQLLQPHPFVLYNLGMAQAAARRPASAIKTFNEYLASNDVEQSDAKAREVRALITELTAKVGHVELEIEPPGAELRIDGKLQPIHESIMLDPGPHSLTATAPRYAPQELELPIAEGERRSLSLRLVPTDPEPPRSSDSRAGPPLPLRPARVFFLRADATAGATAALTPLRPDHAGVSPEPHRTPLWFFMTMAGTGVMLGATATGVAIDSSRRYATWRSEEAALAAASDGAALDAALLERQRNNRERAERVKFEDGLATGLGVASGVVLAATALWWLVDSKSSTRAVAVASAGGQALLSGRFP